ncbi:MAG: chemotaxis-specific protein-glutamate methyltransferase CheB [Actinomycetia bacterium]|nr:chemotaxis-specific protein-glutamate methyltransferase CheB [Actinomycetes bacterium]
MDDSDVVCRLVAAVIGTDPRLEVVGAAANGKEALAIVETEHPDVVILDLEMPVMDGETTYAELHARHPDIKVVIFSNQELSPRSALARALQAKELDFVAKPEDVTDVGDAMTKLGRLLLPKLRPHTDKPRPTLARSVLRSTQKPTISAVVIGASTGGPHALEQVLKGLRDRVGVPIFIVDHIAAEFTDRLVEQLNKVSAAPVIEAEAGTTPTAGTIYVAPGGTHLKLVRDRGRVVMTADDSPPVNSCRPAVDILFQSAVEVYGRNLLGIILTGMGHDGLEGCRAMAARGAPILVQDEETSVVWGMPGAVANAGLADEIVPITHIAGSLIRWTASRRRSRDAAQ